MLLLLRAMRDVNLGPRDWGPTERAAFGGLGEQAVIWNVTWTGRCSRLWCWYPAHVSHRRGRGRRVGSRTRLDEPAGRVDRRLMEGSCFSTHVPSCRRMKSVHDPTHLSRRALLLLSLFPRFGLPLLLFLVLEHAQPHGLHQHHLLEIVHAVPVRTSARPPATGTCAEVTGHAPTTSSPNPGPARSRHELLERFLRHFGRDRTRLRARDRRPRGRVPDGNQPVPDLFRASATTGKVSPSVQSLEPGIEPRSPDIPYA